VPTGGAPLNGSTLGGHRRRTELVLNLLRGLAVLGVLIAVLFGSAGRWDLPFF